MRNSLTGLLLLAVAGLSMAEERFYPVVGPDGRVRVIKGEATPPGQEALGAGAAIPAPARQGSSEDSRFEQPAGGSDAPGVAARGSVTSESGRVSPTAAAMAPYDSEEYTDVEDIEGTAGEPGAPERFYLIHDGSGQHVTRSQGDGGPAVHPTVVVAAPEQRYAALPSNLQIDEEVGDDERPAGLPACIGARELAAARTAEGGTPVTVVVNRSTYMFMGPGKVVAIIRLGEGGLRTLVSRSYASKDRTPAFLDPELFFLDGNGCFRRRASGLFERSYGPTPKRHPMLRGELLVHGDEEYVLVVAATRSGTAVADSPFPVSSNGQLSFSIKK